MGLRDLIFRRRDSETPREMTQLQMLTSGSNISSYISTELHRSDLVRSAVQPFATHVGKLAPIHYFGDEKMPNPMIRKLLEKPNPRMSMQKLLEKTVSSLKLDGNAYIYKRYENAVIVELTPLQPESVTAVKDDFGNIYLKFVFFGDAEPQTIPYSHIIHLRSDFYKCDFFGDSPAEVLKELMETVTTTDKGIRQAIQSSLVVRWIMKFTNSMRKEDIETHLKEMNKNFMTLDSEFGGVFPVDPKYSIEQVKNENKLYMPDNNIQKNLVSRVYNFFNVNEKIINSTYTEEEFNSWYESGIAPLAKQLSDVFTHEFFTEREQAHGNKIIFQTNSLMFASLKTKLELVSVMDRGAMSLNEFREIFGLIPLEEDKFILRREYGNLGEVAGGDSLTHESTEGGEDSGNNEQE